MNERPLADVELAGERVRLVPVAPRFAARAFELLRDNDAVLRWLIWDGPRDRAELEESFAAWARPKTHGTDHLLAILDRAGDAFVGTIGLRASPAPDTADVGYWLAPEAWGRGMMSEAVRLVGRLAFAHLGAAVLTASAFVGNDASRRVLEKSGYRFTHTLRGSVVKRGVPTDEWFFTLTRHDFEAATGDWAPAVERVAFAGE